MKPWENMNAGSDIDEVVAQRVGWNHSNGSWWYMSTDAEGGNSIKKSPCPMYSRDWRATGNLIEHIEKSGFSMTVKMVKSGVYESTIRNNGFSVPGCGTSNLHVAQAPSAQLAIVKSFLRATEV